MTTTLRPIPGASSDLGRRWCFCFFRKSADIDLPMCMRPEFGGIRGVVGRPRGELAWPFKEGGSETNGCFVDVLELLGDDRGLPGHERSRPQGPAWGPTAVFPTHDVISDVSADGVEAGGS